jgi:radical SAM family protein
MSIGIVRPPFTYRFSDLEVFEEPIITYLLGYFEAVGFSDYCVYDFHLTRSLTISSILAARHSALVVIVRETVEAIHYAQRVAARAREDSASPIYVYGQVGRLDRLNWPTGTYLVRHDEAELARGLGIRTDGPTYADGLVAKPYIDRDSLSASQARRFKAALETTRGCPFPCSFCFINSGQNYPARWAQRRTSDVLADVERYYREGVRNIVFYDSEFLGLSSNEHKEKRDLLGKLTSAFPDLNYKVYCRADTLERFNGYGDLKKSGLKQVFMGIESLFQPDLDALKKKLRLESVYGAIDSLIEHEVFLTLSFITFNRNTTLDSLDANIAALKNLYRRYYSERRFLGMPNFVFGLESDWAGAVLPGRIGELSDLTYVKMDLIQKVQPGGGRPVFDARLEPLIEIYRLLAYEWAKKVVELSKYRETATAAALPAIEAWFTALPEFCLLTMERFLGKFRKGELRSDNLSVYRDELFAIIDLFYGGLPAECRQLATYDDHASQITYRDTVPQLEIEEYWVEHI